jgi:hypothetical protein
LHLWGYVDMTDSIKYSFTGNYPRLFDVPTIEFLNLILQSAFTPNCKILSSLLVTMPSLGKSTYLDLTRSLDFVHYTNDVSPKPLLDFLDEVEKGRKKFLVIPDFINALSHNKNTVDATRSILRSMIEEGFKGSDYFGMTRDYEQPVKAGLLSGITVDKAIENTGRWKSDGFYSRLVPWSYAHSVPTSHSIIQDKLDGATPIKQITFKIIKNPVEPKIPENIKDKIMLLAYQMTSETYNGAVYRPLEHVMSLCKNSAVLRESDIVELADIEKIQALSTWINRKQNSI